MNKLWILGIALAAGLSWKLLRLKQSAEKLRVLLLPPHLPNVSGSLVSFPLTIQIDNHSDSRFVLEKLWVSIYLWKDTDWQLVGGSAPVSDASVIAPAATTKIQTSPRVSLTELIRFVRFDLFKPLDLIEKFKTLPVKLETNLKVSGISITESVVLNESSL